MQRYTYIYIYVYICMYAYTHVYPARLRTGSTQSYEAAAATGNPHEPTWNCAALCQA